MGDTSATGGWPARPPGPVELVVIAIPDLSASRHLADAMRELVHSASIRILDLVVVQNQMGGSCTVLELEEVAGLARLWDVEGEVGGWLTEEDIALTCGALPVGTTAVLLVAEDTWASPLADAVHACGGRIVGGERIPAARVPKPRQEER